MADSAYFFSLNYPYLVNMWLRVELDNELLNDLLNLYLGLYLSNDLSWAKHIDKLCTKLPQKVAILGRTKSKVPKVILK